MKKTLFLLLLSSKAIFAQFGLADQYQFNLLALNPAFAGERGNFGVTAMLGNQFNGNFAPNQVAQVISLDGKIGTGNSSIGFQGFRNTLTSNTNNGLALSYAYSFHTGSLKINIGLNAGFSITPNYVGVQNFTQQMSPFGGLGITAISENGFVSISSPTLFTNPTFLNLVSQPLNLMAGYRLGNADNIALNISALLGTELNQGNSSFLHMNPKIWLGNKIGLGGSFRFRTNTEFAAIPMIEMKISESSTIGLSYDSQPLRLYSINSDSINPNGLFQLMFRYDVFNTGESTPLLNLF